MSIYRYPATSAVAQAQFRYANKRAPVAMLTAQDHVDYDQLSTIRRAMEAHGWQCVPAVVEGKNVLQVSGFKEEGELAALLATHGLADATPIIIPEPGDHPTKTISDWLEHTSLKAAGWLNLVGDIALLGAGIKSGREQEVTAGVLYTGGAAVLARYANVKTEHQVQRVLDRTAGFMQQQAAQLPEDTALSTIARDRKTGVIKNTEDFLYRYPAEVMLSAYTLGAFSMLRSGIKQGNPWGIAYGANSVALKAASLMIPEKGKMDPADKQGAGPVRSVINWVQEKPLRLFGFGSLVSDALLGMSALREYKLNPRQQGHMLKFITTGTYIAADMLIAVSNKHVENADGKFHPDEQRRIEAMAAETIARQPEPMRAGLVQQVAGFLSTQPEMRGSASDISDGIKEQVVQQAKNPWASHVVASQNVPTQVQR
jgi:hypothetical protein